MTIDERGVDRIAVNGKTVDGMAVNGMTINGIAVDGKGLNEKRFIKVVTKTGKYKG